MSSSEYTDNIEDDDVDDMTEVSDCRRRRRLIDDDDDDDDDVSVENDDDDDDDVSVASNDDDDDDKDDVSSTDAESSFSGADADNINEELRRASDVEGNSLSENNVPSEESEKPKKDPSVVPKSGMFYMHDNRENDTDCAEEHKIVALSRRSVADKVDVWKHDRFNAIDIKPEEVDRRESSSKRRRTFRQRKTNWRMKSRDNTQVDNLPSSSYQQAPIQRYTRRINHSRGRRGSDGVRHEKRGRITNPRFIERRLSEPNQSSSSVSHLSPEQNMNVKPRVHSVPSSLPAQTVNTPSLPQRNTRRHNQRHSRREHYRNRRNFGHQNHRNFRHTKNTDMSVTSPDACVQNPESEKRVCEQQRADSSNQYATQRPLSEPKHSTSFDSHPRHQSRMNANAREFVFSITDSLETLSVGAKVHTQNGLTSNSNVPFHSQVQNKPSETLAENSSAPNLTQRDTEAQYYRFEHNKQRERRSANKAQRQSSEPKNPSSPPSTMNANAQEFSWSVSESLEIVPDDAQIPQKNSVIYTSRAHHQSQTQSLPSSTKMLQQTSAPFIPSKDTNANTYSHQQNNFIASGENEGSLHRYNTTHHLSETTHSSMPQSPSNTKSKMNANAQEFALHSSEHQEHLNSFTPQELFEQEQELYASAMYEQNQSQMMPNDVMSMTPEMAAATYGYGLSVPNIYHQQVQQEQLVPNMYQTPYTNHSDLNSMAAQTMLHHSVESNTTPKQSGSDDRNQLERPKRFSEISLHN